MQPGWRGHYTLVTMSWVHLSTQSPTKTVEVGAMFPGLHFPEGDMDSDGQVTCPGEFTAHRGWQGRSQGVSTSCSFHPVHEDLFILTNHWGPLLPSTGLGLG